MQKKKNRKTAPPGFLTAKEAMTTIGVPSTTFYNLVKDGIIPSVTLPGRKEAVYPLRKIEQYKRSLREAMSPYTFTQEYYFGLALKDDISAIRTLVASESGGYEHTVPREVLEAWMRKNPEALHILSKGAEIVGYISLFPLPLEVIMKRLSGEYWNRTIPIDDIQPFVPKTPYPLYIAEMAAKKETDSSNPRSNGVRLIYETLRQLINWTQEGIVFNDIYAVGTSEAGIRTCRELGMEPVDLPEGAREKRVPFHLDIRHSDQSRLVARYRRSIPQ